MKYNGAFFVFAVSGLILCVGFDFVSTSCNTCHSGNPTACHNETTYSLCIDGVPSYDLIVCPPDYVCTDLPQVCYPKETSIPFCKSEDNEGLCGICDNRAQVFSCINETTIAFCFGNSEPNFEALAYCPEKSVCDLNNAEFCSDEVQVQPSCRKQFHETTVQPETTTQTTELKTEEPTTSTNSPTTTITTDEPTTTTEELTTTTGETTTTIGITTEESTASTEESTSTTEEPTSTTEASTTTQATTEEPITTTEALTTKTEEITTTTPTTTTENNATTEVTTEEPTTTTTPPREPTALCRDKQESGFHKADGDATCKNYIYCYKCATKWCASELVCSGNEYFHEDLQVCHSTKPAGCL